MGKKTIITLAVIAAGYLGTTWYLGEQTEIAYRETIAASNSLLANIAGLPPEAKIQVEIKDYQRNFFSSDALFEVTLAVDHRSSISFQYKEHIEHGPLPMAGVMRGELMPVLARAQGQLVANEFNQKWFDLVAKQGNLPVTSLTYIGFNTKGRAQLNFAPIDFAEKEDRIQLSPAHFTVDYNLLAHDFVIDGALPKLSMLMASGVNQHDPVNIELHNITLTSDYKAYGQANGGGYSNIVIDKLQVLDKFSMDKLSARTDETVVDNVAAYAVTYNVDSIKLGDYDLGQFNAKLNLENINKPAVEKFQRYAAAMQTGPMMGLMIDILKLKPALTLEPLAWSNSKGRSYLNLGMQMSIIDMSKVGSTPVEIALGLIPHAHVNGGLSRDMMVELFQYRESQTQKSAADALLGFDAMVGVFSEEKLVTVKDDMVNFDFVLDTGKVNINGEEMTLAEFTEKYQSAIFQSSAQLSEAEDFEYEDGEQADHDDVQGIEDWDEADAAGEAEYDAE